MIQTKPRHKRGAEFIHIPTGETVYLYIIRNDETYIVSFDKNLNEVFEAKLSDLKPAKPLQVSSISNKPKVSTEGQKNERNAMNEFFAQVALRMPFNCAECGKPLYASTKVGKRAASAHILPKAKFESVAMDENNIFFLGAAYIGQCGCHDRWDANVDSRIKMKVYDVAIWRFEKYLKAKLTPEELKAAYTYLNIEWK